MNFILFIYLFAAIFLFWEVTIFIIKYKSIFRFILFLLLGFLFIFKVGFTFFLVELPLFFEYLSFCILILILFSILFIKHGVGVRS
jgi:hypothetical protein